MNDRNIVITGFMGTGKSTVGRLVAEQLSWPFLDTDAEIVRRAGKPIADIFAQQGEAAFRQMEARLCRFLAAQRGYVIATGGGMLVDAGNRAVMLSASGLVVCLTATPEVVEERLRADDNQRPLLKGDWHALLEQRRSAYAAIPHQIDTSGRSPHAVAEDIIKLWQSSP